MRWKIASALMATAISQIDQSNGFTANPNMISHMDESGTDFAKAMLMSEFFPEPVKTRKKDDWLTTALRKYPRGELTDLMRFAYERIVSDVQLENILNQLDSNPKPFEFCFRFSINFKTIFETTKSDKSVHGGDIYGFFLANQKRYQKAVIEKDWFRIDYVTYSLISDSISLKL